MSASDGAQLNPTIEEILTDEELALLFREFLRQLQCAENLSFFIETEDYKRAQDASVREEKAAKIWAKFLGQNATAPLNIDSKCRQRISERLDSGDLDIFDEASEFVFSMLSLDCYRKFVVSEIYKQWLAGEAKKKPKWGFLFFGKKKSADKRDHGLAKTDSVVLLQRHVALSNASKK